jgi:hypothetical protein
MRRILGLSALLAGIVVGVAALGGAQGSKPTSSSINVTATVYDYDGGGVELLLRSDDYSGTGQATYTSTSSGGSSLSSHITSSGEFELLLYNQSLRTVWITPNDPVGSEPTGPSAGHYWKGSDVRSECFDQNGSIVPLANVVTSSGNCKLGVNFNSAGTLYNVANLYSYTGTSKSPWVFIGQYNNTFRAGVANP